MGITNTVGSTISRITHCGIHINAGPEIGVASTKAYTSQCVSMVMLAIQLSQDKQDKQERRAEIIEGLKNLPGHIKKVLEDEPGLKTLSERRIKDNQTILLFGRGYQLATCLEGALKIKEISYIHSEGIGSGELKHGPLALVDDKTCIIMLMTDDGDKGKIQNAFEQVRSRGGKPIIICNEGAVGTTGDEVKIIVPSTTDCLQGIVNVVVLQLISYHTATSLGYNVDCPRNLAKSVTVE